MVLSPRLRTTEDGLQQSGKAGNDRERTGEIGKGRKGSKTFGTNRERPGTMENDRKQSGKAGNDGKRSEPIGRGRER